MADEATGAIVPAEEIQDQADELETAGEESGEESTSEASHEEGETEGERKRPSGAQRNKLRIQKLEQELEKWRDTALGFAQTRTAPTEAKKETAPPVEDKRPRKEDFIVDKEAGTYDADKYEQAVDDWRDRQYEKKLETKLAEREQTSQKQTEQQRIEQTWRERETAVAAEYDDYKELATVAVSFLKQNSQSPTAQALGAAITDSDVGPQLLRHLGEDYEALERIAKLSPLAAVRELGKLEARLAQEKTAEKVEDDDPPPPPPKQPPKPPTTIKKTGAVNTPDPEKMSFPDYCAWRAKEGARK